ncbi:MAG: hypothetical protein JRF72_09120 [Deltaproteobacteria bacterium]|jgi:hypothetical protein|nr:hypothetical protein [Deltaproteobacteria bacterium]
MNFPVSHSYPLTRAYVEFERQSIPFAAIKLNISMQKWNKQECDEIVADNYRSENDVVFKNQDEYVILMQDTTLEIAEAATYRLRKRLGQLSTFSKKIGDINPIQASAHILGSSHGTDKLLVRYLDLSPQVGFKAQSESVRPNLNEYLKWQDGPGNTNNQFTQRINIKI